VSCGEAARRMGVKNKQTNVINCVRERDTPFIAIGTLVAVFNFSRQANGLNFARQGCRSIDFSLCPGDSVDCEITGTD